MVWDMMIHVPEVLQKSLHLCIQTSFFFSLGVGPLGWRAPEEIAIVVTNFILFAHSSFLFTFASSFLTLAASCSAALRDFSSALCFFLPSLSFFFNSRSFFRSPYPAGCVSSSFLFPSEVVNNSTHEHELRLRRSITYIYVGHDSDLIVHIKRETYSELKSGGTKVLGKLYKYRIAGKFRGMLIFVIFVVKLVVTKFSTREN